MESKAELQGEWMVIHVQYLLMLVLYKLGHLGNDVTHINKVLTTNDTVTDKWTQPPLFKNVGYDRNEASR